MQRFLPLIILILFFFSLNANEWIKLNGTKQDNNNITLLKSNISSSTLKFSLEGFWKKEVETINGKAWLISVKDGVSMLQKGAPDLPLFSTSLIIPDLSKMDINIVSSKFTEFNDITIAPSKGNLLRTTNPNTIPYEYGKIYGTDSYYPSEIAKLREPYIVRDLRGQTLLIQPMQYNPISRTLRVFYEITIEVVENGVSDINTKPENNSSKLTKPFISVYNRHFINYKNSTRYVPVEESGNMLIISHADFMEEIQPLIDWKIMSGTPVEIVDVSTIGGSSDIKQYITNYYNNNELTYVILVGDSQQIPSSVIGGNDSDVDYSYTDGNDHYPDIFVGRFSAETEGQVTTQVTRVIDYEQNPVEDSIWYSKAIGIASSEGPGAEDEYDYEHIRNIGDNKLIPFTYNHAFEFFDGTQGGNDATGNPNPSIISDAINSGASIINYTGHGSTTAWLSSGFSNNDVNNLTNTDKLPFIFSVACVNGNFVNNTCFAEAWLRAEHNGEPSGAIAAFMSTINQSWNPPMCGQDEMNDILSEAYSQNIKRTFGGISMNGCMKMNDSYGSDGDEMTDTWTIFGDPSLEIRTAKPQDLIVTHSPTLIIGTTSLSITCDSEGSLATLSLNGEILGTTIVESGEATIYFDQLSTLGTADFVVTNFNYRPYISTIDIVLEEGAYVIYANSSINDIAGNNNGLMDYSESILLTIGLTNAGIEDAHGVTASLSTTSEYVELITTEASYGDIIANDTISVIDAFAFNVANNIPDEIIANFIVSAQDANGIDIWESSFNLTGHTPNLLFSNFTVNDQNGNNNGKIDPGETVDIIIETSNQGSSEAYNVLSDLSSSNTYITINSDPQLVGDLPENSSGEVVFSITADGGTPDGANIMFNVDITADHEILGEGNFFVIVGQKPILIINLSNSNSADSMQACFNRLQVGIDEVGSIPNDIDMYKSLFILLGIYPNNYVLNNAEGDRLTDYLLNGGRIYMEGGDAWAFDPQTSAHELFHIVGLDDGSDDLLVVIGEDSGIMNGLSFEYGITSNYIDHIEPVSGSELIFSNSNPQYGTGVSYENSLYKTIGTSFEYAGLIDRELSTKDMVMSEILRFFDIEYIWTSIVKNEAENVDVVAYPVPASTNATIQIVLKQSKELSLSVYNLTGQIVIELENSKRLNPGTYNYIWNTINVNPGIYIYKLTVGSEVITNKIIVR
jgi:peptidase C25-like protein/type IX secretion system substrate protein